jgi:hypothetical protein
VMCYTMLTLRRWSLREGAPSEVVYLWKRKEVEYASSEANTQRYQLELSHK